MAERPVRKDWILGFRLEIKHCPSAWNRSLWVQPLGERRASAAAKADLALSLPDPFLVGEDAEERGACVAAGTRLAAALTRLGWFCVDLYLNCLCVCPLKINL